MRPPESTTTAPFFSVFGVLTQRPSAPLERSMQTHFEQNSDSRLTVVHAVFTDETDERGPSIVALERPSYAPWPQMQCVAKILEWLRYASEHEWGLPGAAPAFVGWFDADTWFHPQRLATHLVRVAHAVPRAVARSGLVWGGLFEHWERASWDQPEPPASLGGVGFSYSSPGPAMAHKETDPSFLRRSAAERRRLSFAMTRRGWSKTPPTLPEDRAPSASPRPSEGSGRAAQSEA